MVVGSKGRISHQSVHLVGSATSLESALEFIALALYLSNIFYLVSGLLLPSPKQAKGPFIKMSFSSPHIA